MTDIETWNSSSFEAKYNTMMGGMSEDEQRRSAKQVLHLCKCDECSTNIESGELNAVYCTLGKSKEIHERKGCLCSDCPITKTMSLRWEYYCIRGSAVELSNIGTNESR